MNYDEDGDAYSIEALCGCGRTYNAAQFNSCYDCYLTRRSEYVNCVFCDRWHSPDFDTCFACRRITGRQEAARAMRLYILHRDDYRCRSCGDYGDLHVDHIKPCAKGGDANPWNLQALCRRENLIKADMWIPGGRWDRFRRELIGYYFLAGRYWLTPEQMTSLRVEVEAIRGVARHERELRKRRDQTGVRT